MSVAGIFPGISQLPVLINVLIIVVTVKIDIVLFSATVM